MKPVVGLPDVHDRIERHGGRERGMRIAHGRQREPARVRRAPHADLARVVRARASRASRSCPTHPSSRRSPSGCKRPAARGTSRSRPPSGSVRGDPGTRRCSRRRACGRPWRRPGASCRAENFELASYGVRSSRIGSGRRGLLWREDDGVQLDAVTHRHHLLAHGEVVLRVRLAERRLRRNRPREEQRERDGEE